MSTARAIVTGGAGFIGSHLVDALVGRGVDVLVVDDLSKGRRDRVDGATFAQVDIRDAAAVSATFATHRPATIFHLAAQADVRVSVGDPAADAMVNVIGTLNVLAAAKDVNGRVVFASTGGAIYGDTNDRPTPETSPTLPEAPYGTAKLCAEQYLGTYNRLFGTRHTALRLGNVFGPRQDPSGEAGVIAIFARLVLQGDRPTVFGDGLQTRDYVYVGDVVSAMLAASDADEAGLWNVGTGIETTVLDLVEGLARAADRPVAATHVAARAGELQASSIDASAIRAALGWTPAVPLADGLERVVSWVRAGEPVRGPA